MTSLRMVGLIVLVFLISLPATFLMHADFSNWRFPLAAAEAGEEREDHDDTVVDLLHIKAMKEMGEGNYTKAIAIYTKAIERDPKYAFSYIGRGDAYVLNGEFARAIQDYTQAVRLDPDNSSGARERLELARRAQAEN